MTSFNSSIPFQNQTIFWNPLPEGEGWDGFALLVDDVERYIGTALNYSLAALQPGIIHFFRLAVRTLASSDPPSPWPPSCDCESLSVLIMSSPTVYELRSVR